MLKTVGSSGLNKGIDRPGLASVMVDRYLGWIQSAKSIMQKQQECSG